MVSPMRPLHLTLSDLERPTSRSFRHWLVGDQYDIHIFAGSLLLPLVGCQKENLLQAGFSAVPAVFHFFLIQLMVTSVFIKFG